MIWRAQVVLARRISPLTSYTECANTYAFPSLRQSHVAFGIERTVMSMVAAKPEQ
jgi:hypothetical protein